MKQYTLNYLISKSKRIEKYKDTIFKSRDFNKKYFNKKLLSWCFGTEYDVYTRIDAFEYDKDKYFIIIDAFKKLSEKYDVDSGIQLLNIIIKNKVSITFIKDTNRFIMYYYKNNKYDLDYIKKYIDNRIEKHLTLKHIVLNFIHYNKINVKNIPYLLLEY